MFTADDWKSRFNLLYLHEGEVKTEERPARCRFEDSEHNKNLDEAGMLHIGSKSLFFEPRKENLPIHKFLMKFFSSEIKGHSVLGEGDKSCYELKFSVEAYIQIVVLSNTPSEHKTTYLKKPIEITIVLDSNQGERAWIQSLVTLNKTVSKAGLDHIYEVSKFMIMHYNFKKFDMANLESINETSLFKDEEIVVTEIRPLTVNYGFLFITNLNMYVQSITTLESKVWRSPLRSIVKMFKRRYNLADRAIEFFLNTDESYFFAFDTPSLRDRIFDAIRHRNTDCITDDQLSLSEQTQRWKQRLISNYDYLKILNEFGHRSFNDLAQYPVFPWVLADYTSEELDLNNPEVFRELSLPIGAINHDRLMEFVERYKNMPSPKYLYGTHYSSPFYVVGYLVRQYPLYMLHLNNGKFDRPDRIFYSINEDWKVRSLSRLLTVPNPSSAILPRP
jgi:factor associated with neutral sphingomyelinase activation